VLTAGGIASLIAGALILFNSPLYRVSLLVVVAVAATTGLFFAFAIAKVVRAQSWPVVTGREGLIGRLAEARTPLDPEGSVFIQGELWHATVVDGPIAQGEQVEIVAMEGLRLTVKRAPEQKPS
jgi:membrane-bound serine protease (ClpP class)